MEVKRVNKTIPLTQDLSISVRDPGLLGLGHWQHALFLQLLQGDTQGRTVAQEGAQGRAGAATEGRRRRGESDSVVLLIRKKLMGGLKQRLLHRILAFGTRIKISG